MKLKAEIFPSVHLSFREIAFERFSAIFFSIYQVVFGIEGNFKVIVSQLFPTNLIVWLDSWLLY